MHKIRSYTSEDSSALSFFREAISLHRYWKSRERAREAIDDVRSTEARVKDFLHLELRGLDILEIGPGQFQAQLKYLAMNNRVVGIDLNVLPGRSPIAYLKMLGTNGVRRTAKTVGRKLLGIDRRFEFELRRHMGVQRLPKPNVIQMDACHMSFPDDSFDFVYARSVFHHLPNPRAALDGIVRVLKPGGAVYILLHLYTSQSGCLDPRVYTDRSSEVQGWPHLRPELRGTVDGQNTYVNKLRLDEWRSLFGSKLPEANYFATRSSDATFASAKALHEQGKLVEYSLEELTTQDFAVLWQKPTR